MIGMNKFKFQPFQRYAEGTPVNREKLNSIRSLYYGYQESSFPVENISKEFYRAVGQILMGCGLEDLNLEYLEFEREKGTKEIILSVPLLEEQISDLLESDLRQETKEGLHNLLGNLLDCCDEDIRKITLKPVYEKETEE